ncbi:MAG: hypothetical protein AB8H47_08545 [Bacteroidia bacterium]
MMNTLFARSYFGFLFVSLMLVACKQDLPGELKVKNCRDGECSYSYVEGQSIEIVHDSVNQSTFVEIVNGDKLVFKYLYTADDEDYIADDEYTENIYFEIDPEVESFSFRDEEMADIQLTIQPICFCVPLIYEPRIGSLSGKRLNNTTWEVSLDVSYEQYGSTTEINFTEKFESQ